MEEAEEETNHKPSVPRRPPFTKKRNNVSFSNQPLPPPPPRPYYTSPYSHHYSSPIQYSWTGAQPDWGHAPRNRWSGDPESPFVRSAEASVRDAFASIESIVTAFTSVAQMLEATYSSVHSSFRAVLSVADHFSKLRQQLVKILRGFMMLGIGQRVFQRLWNCVTHSHSTHEAVQKVAWEMANPQPGQQDLWPFVTFILVACVGPYFIYKMFPDVKEEEEDEETQETAIVVHPYRALTHDEVSLLENSEVVIAPPHLQPNFTGWTLVSSNGVIGLVPTSHLRFDNTPD